MRVFVQQVNDEVLVTHPSVERLQELIASGLTIDEALDSIQERDAPGSIRMKPTQVALDRTFRAAWKIKSGNAGLEIDLPKAKLIAHDRRRTRRSILLAPHDALATSPIAAIKNKANADKQAILDADAPVQTAIDAATTPEQLKQILVNYQAVQ